MMLHHFRCLTMAAAAVVLTLLSAGTQSVQAQQIVDVVDMGFFDISGQMSLNPNTGRLYVPGNGHVYVVDTGTNAVVDELDVTSALSTAYDPVRNQVYVSRGAEIAVFDADTHEYVQSFSAYAWFLDVNPLTSRVYSVTSDVLYVTDAAAGPDEHYEIAAVPMPLSNCWDVVVHPGMNTIYVSSFDGLIAVDGETHEILAVIPTGDHSYIPRVAIDRELNQLYAPAYNGTVVIDCVTNEIKGTIRSPGEGMSVGVDAVTHRVYVTNDFQGPGAGSNNRSTSPNPNGVFAPPDGLVIIDGATGSIAGKHEFPYCQGVAVDPVTGLVYLADRGSATGENDLFVFEDVAPGGR